LRGGIEGGGRKVETQKIIDEDRDCYRLTSPRWGEVERSEGEGESAIRKGHNPSPAALTRVDLSLKER